MKKTICIFIMLASVFILSGAAFAADYIYAASVEGEITLYISPDDESLAVTKIPACSKLKLLDTERTWGLVEFKNKTGWINLSFTRSNYSKSAESTGNDWTKSVQVKAKDGKAVLYNIPSEDILLGSAEKYKIPNDTVLKIIRQTPSGWGLVSMHGKYAWIKVDETVPYKAEEGEHYGIYYVYVVSEGGKGAELWAKDDGTELCAVIPDCIKLTVREQKGKFGYVSYNGINGWINLDYTTESLANAQSNAGTPVNSEYTVTPPEGEESVNILSVPSENPLDGGTVVATLEGGESVFVLRSTLSGWSLVYIDGNPGWIPPECLTPAEIMEENLIRIYESPESLFVATAEQKGMALYSGTDLKTKIATVPETVEIKVLAEKEGCKYIYCDYAAGWSDKVETVATQKEAVELYPGEKMLFYVTEQDTELMSLPTMSEACGSAVLSLVEKGKYFEIIKTVSTAKSKWLLAEIDGTRGWIKASHANKAKLSLMMVLTVLLIIAALLALAALAVKIIRKKKKTSGKKRKEVKENEKGVYDENSGSGEESPNVSCER